jgi:hypothetical protein
MKVKLAPCPDCGRHFDEELANLKPGHVVRCAGGCRSVCIIQESDMTEILDRLSNMPTEGTA